MVDFSPITRRKMNTNQPTNPPNADVVLNRFKTPTPPPVTTPPEQTGPQASTEEPNWLKAKSLLRSTVKDKASSEVGAIEQIIHQLHVQLELAQHELSGVKQALAAKEKKKDKNKVLPLYAHNLEWHGGAKWWSPSSKREADAREAAYEAYQQQVEAEKATRRELQQTEKLLKQQHQEQKRELRKKEKEERDRQRAEERAQIDARKAAREAQKRDRDAAKSIQLPQRGKRKYSQSAAPRKKQNRGGAAARSHTVADQRSPTPPPTYNSRGRKIALPKRFE